MSLCVFTCALAYRNMNGFDVNKWRHAHGVVYTFANRRIESVLRDNNLDGNTFDCIIRNVIDFLDVS